MDDDEKTGKKPHRARLSGRKAEKKKGKHSQVQELTDKQRNPKAFAINSAVRAEKGFRRTQDIKRKKEHIPVIDRTPVEPPPIIVAIVGPPKVGKSLLLKCLIKSYTRQPLTEMKGPVTVVSGKKRRITFIECNDNIYSMIDIAKVADLVLLLIDASFGFEMELFEFLTVCQVHGMPRIMGVLTHLDSIKRVKNVQKTKKVLKHRFWKEVHPGAKLFYLSNLQNGSYLKNEVKNLSRFISVMKFRPLTWQSSHSYVLVDRLEDVTPPGDIQLNKTIDRCVCLYGYMRGVPMNKNCFIHVPGCGDFGVNDVSFLPDPCPLPEQIKKRSLLDKERSLYAPFSGVGGIVFDKDAVYVDVPSTQTVKRGPESEILNDLLKNEETLDVKLARSKIQLFSGGPALSAGDFEEMDSSEQPELPDYSNKVYETVICEDGRKRRRVLSDVEKNDSDSDEENDFDSDKKGDNVICEENGRKRQRVLSDIVEKNYSDSDEENESDSDEENDSGSSDENESNSNDVYETICEDDGRRRRRVLSNAVNNDSDSEEENNSDSEETDSNSDNENGSYNEEENDSADEEELYETDLNWKSNLAEKAAKAFIERQSERCNLMKLVYGDYCEDEKNNTNDRGESDDLAGFSETMSRRQTEKASVRENINAIETSKFPSSQIRDWSNDMNIESIKDCFVTGKWDEDEDAEELLKLDDLNESEEELYGDFEDLETGEKYVSKSGEGTEKQELTKEKLLEKKRKLKEKFNEEYENKMDDEDDSYFDELKNKAKEQSELNKKLFEGLDDNLRVEVEGYRAGLYVRIEIANMPCEFVDNFDPTFPVIVGSVQPGEQNIGFVKVRLRKHRWYNRILKTRDPLIISLGWRRFQTMCVYSQLEDNMRHRMLKYTPKHLSCMGHFWGPITKAQTGMLALVNPPNPEKVKAEFRIVATGVVVDTNQSTVVTKKLKLKGVPTKIFKKTAFIEKMFTSALEVSRFEGAKIKTVSGIRGQIKKALTKPDGAFRATFEDKILMSDIVFCRTWCKYEVPKFYACMTNLLLPLNKKDFWSGMKTVGQLKRERGIHNEAQEDSMYTKIERNKTRISRRLVIPRALERELPYKFKCKEPLVTKKETLPFMKRVKNIVVRDEHESNVASLLQKIKTNYRAKKVKTIKETRERIMKFRKVKRAENMRQLKKQKEMKKRIYRTLGKMEADKEKFNKRQKN